MALLVWFVFSWLLVVCFGLICLWFELVAVVCCFIGYVCLLCCACVVWLFVLILCLLCVCGFEVGLLV